MKKLFFLMLIGLLIFSCGYRGPMNNIRTTSNSPATVNVKRIWSLNIGAQPFYFAVNETEIYSIGNGENFSFNIDPGVYRFSVKSTGGFKMWNYHFIDVSILRGRTYYIILEADFSGGAKISLDRS